VIFAPLGEDEMNLIFWLWPIVVLGSVALVGVVAARSDDRHFHKRNHPAE
jgi:hypothetical protein